MTVDIVSRIEVWARKEERCYRLEVRVSTPLPQLSGPRLAFSVGVWGTVVEAYDAQGLIEQI